jgi:hypothetical protein
MHRFQSRAGVKGKGKSTPTSVVSCVFHRRADWY